LAEVRLNRVLGQPLVAFVLLSMVQRSVQREPGTCRQHRSNAAPTRPAQGLRSDKRSLRFTKTEWCWVSWSRGGQQTALASPL